MPKYKKIVRQGRAKAAMMNELRRAKRTGKISHDEAPTTSKDSQQNYVDSASKNYQTDAQLPLMEISNIQPIEISNNITLNEPRPQESSEDNVASNEQIQNQETPGPSEIQLEGSKEKSVDQIVGETNESQTGDILVKERKPSRKRKTDTSLYTKRVLPRRELIPKPIPKPAVKAVKAVKPANDGDQPKRKAAKPVNDGNQPKRKAAKPVNDVNQPKRKYRKKNRVDVATDAEDINVQEIAATLDRALDAHLSRADRDQRQIAKKLINYIIYYANNGELSSNTVVINVNYNEEPPTTKKSPEKVVSLGCNPVLNTLFLSRDKLCSSDVSDDPGPTNAPEPMQLQPLIVDPLRSDSPTQYIIKLEPEDYHNKDHEINETVLAVDALITQELT